MGLEGAVELGFSKELAAAPDAETRKTLYDDLVAKMYARARVFRSHKSTRSMLSSTPATPGHGSSAD